ncbi:hypothetical protein pb186bvf_000690 [Paramecium bursaria]
MSREQTIKLLGSLSDPSLVRKQRQQDAVRKYQQLLDKLSFRDNRYSEMLPYIHFYKLLARNNESNVNRLKLWIPDTVVLNDKEMPNYWLYSDPKGFVFRTDTFTPKNVISKLANYTSPDELVAVMKKQQFRSMELVGNDVKLVCCRDLPNSVSVMFQNRVDIMVVQKYVKSNGPKAFICRTVYRKDKNPISYVITNKEDYFADNVKNETLKYITNPLQMGSCTIVQTCRGKYVDETIPYVKNILTYLHIHLGVSFSEFAADFIKDESGIWWFINVKGFIIDRAPETLQIKNITHYGEEIIGGVIQKQKKGELCSKIKMCKYCEQNYPEQLLSHKMTLKMIVQTDKHLYWRGKSFGWIERSDVTNLEVSNLYHEHKVCKQCYNLYKETEQLIELQLIFNKMLGVPVTEDTNYNMLTLKANKVNNDPMKPNSDQMHSDVQVFDISATKQLVLDELNIPQIHNTVIKQLNRFRFMVLINQLGEIPTYVDLSKHYFIEYQIFDQRQRIRLDIQTSQQNDKGYILLLNRMRLFYIFSNGRVGLSDYLAQQQNLTMTLYCESTALGSIDLDMVEFQSERVIRKEYNKYFCFNKEAPFLQWEINLILGMVDSGPINVTRVKLQEHNGVYLPNPDYCTCEPLPAEWMTTLNQKKDYEQLTRITERQQTSNAVIRAQTSHRIQQDLKNEMESFNHNESTNELYSQVQLQKEIKEYEIDEDERRKKKRRYRPMYDL